MARRRRRQTRIVATIGFLLLILLAGLICYLVWDSYFRDKNENKKDEPATVEMADQKEEKEKEPEVQLGEETKTEDVIDDEKEEPGYDGENPNQGELLTGVITRSERMNDYLVIRVNIDQYLSDGNCRLNLKRDAEIVYTDTVSIVSSAATATCEGFDVPVAEIGEGDYGIEILVNSGDKSGVINGEVGV